MTIGQTTLGTEEVLAVLETIFTAVDRREWALAQSALADEVVLDYGKPETLSPEQVVERWKPLGNLDSTKHSVSNHQVTIHGNVAQCRSTFHALHVLKGASHGDTWVLDGRYEHELVHVDRRWRVRAMKMIPGQSTGNKAIVEDAKARTSSAADERPPRRVKFLSEGTQLAGHLFVPKGSRGGAPLPGVVVTGSWTTVKEQMPDLYARRLAAEGFIALTFDFRGFGESAGEPRDFESPRMKAIDIRNAIGFLQSVAEVDPARVGALAICASSGYVAAASIHGAPIRSMALVAPWLHDAKLVREIYGGESGVRDRIAKGRAARAKYEQSGQVDFIPAASKTDPDAAMYGPFDYYLDPKRGGIPAWDARLALMSWPEWLDYDAIALAPEVRVPTLLVHSEQAAVPEGAKRFYDALTAPKELRWTSGTQMDFYDQEPNVSFAVQAVVEHFRKTLFADRASSSTGESLASTIPG